MDYKEPRCLHCVAGMVRRKDEVVQLCVRVSQYCTPYIATYQFNSCIVLILWFRRRDTLKKAHVKSSAPVPRSECTNTNSNRGSASVARGQFCALLVEDIGPAKLCLKAQGGDLLRLHDADETDQVLVHHPSVSLAHILSSYSLTTRMKLVLAFTLAHSVWQFYDSDWMKSGWTCESVQFMVEMTASQSQGIHTGKPCLPARFHENVVALPEWTNAANVIHRYPRILALGMLLLAVGRETYTPTVATNTPSLQAKLNGDLTAGKLAEKYKHWPYLGHADTAREQLRTIYKTATMSCFDKHIFRNCTLSATVESVQDSDIDRHRAILYDRVVHPLKKVISDMGWDTSLDAFEAITLNDSRRADANTTIPLKSTASEEVAAPQHAHASSASAVDLRNTPRLGSPSLATLSCDRSRSPAMQNASSESSRFQRQVSQVFYKAALFDDETPTEGHTSER